MATRHKFDDAHHWNVSDREIERLCAYISDDGSVAAYCGISRQRVVAIRANMPARERNPKRFLDSRIEPARQADGSGAHLIKYQQAQHSSAQLREALERMFNRFARRHGLDFETAQRLQLSGYRA
jgi:hypothetical protein